MICTIWHHSYILKNVKNTNGGVLLLLKLQAFTPPWEVFTLIKLYKWYQIGQNVPYASVDEG